MVRIQHFARCGLLLVVACVQGCAGGGLKNMFGRSDTDGYQPLEELEAEESRLAESPSAADDESRGPRFASWVPFVGDRRQDEELASADADAITEDPEVAESKPRSWMTNPFRRDDESNLDPFLKEDDSQTAAVAKSDRTPEAIDKRHSLTGANKSIAQVGHEESTTGRKSSVTPASARASEELSFADLVGQAAREPGDAAADDFEEQFRKATLDAADSSETAEQLIVDGSRKSAGRSGARTAAGTDAAGDKLEELERLLAAKKSAAAAARRAAQAKQSIPATSEPASEFNDMIDPQRAVEEGLANAVATTANTRTARSAQAAEGKFNSLFGAAVTGANSLPEISARSVRDNVRSSTQRLTDVSVAEAESLFGDAVRGVAERSSNAIGKAADAVATADLSATGVRNAGLQWVDSKLDSAEVAAIHRTEQQISSAADHFESLFTGRRQSQGDQVPTAPVRDPSDVFAAASYDEVPKQNLLVAAPVQIVSAARPAAGAKSGLATDPFFADAGATMAAGSPNSAAATTEQPASATSGFQISGRTWLLIIGGIIVVALLFAPDRKKVMPVSSTAPQA